MFQPRRQSERRHAPSWGSGRNAALLAALAMLPAVFLFFGRDERPRPVVEVPLPRLGTGSPDVTLAAAPAQKRAAEKQVPAVTFEKHVAPFIKRHCFDCHSGEEANGGVTFDRWTERGAVKAHRKAWEKALKLIRIGRMPPPEDAQRPPQADIEQVVAWLDHELYYVDCSQPRDPGRVTIRRLNRQEYKNTIRDLLGVECQLADDFPADDVGYGFDNIGDVLSLPTLLMEKYLDAAEQVARAAIVTEDPTRAEVRRFTAGQTQGGNSVQGAWRGLFSQGEVWTDVDFPHDAEYILRAHAWGDQAGGEPPKMEFRLDGKRQHVADVPAKQRKPGVYEKRVAVKAGRRRLALAFINDYYKPNDPNPANRDRNLYVGTLEVEGPLGLKPPPLPESHTRLITRTPDKKHSWEACAREVLTKFARRAYRRPLRPGEVDRLLPLVEMSRKRGDRFEQAIQLAAQAVLVSPHFLYRVELDPEPNDPTAVRQLNEHELAVRLSYFLWSSMPDEELFRQAEAGTLRKNLAAQVQRMLRDPRSEALVENFCSQWLTIRNLETAVPDPKRFPAWNDALRDAMRTESELYFATIVREDRSIFELLDSDYTFVNETLARHYGLQGVRGNQFRRVRLPDGRRGGVLTQASVLTVTSSPTRTTPVKRGKWIMEQILGTPPPPPPPNVKQLNEQAELTGSLRQRLEQHRRDPNCAVCHRQMDALGFALENYNAIGAWREKDGRFPIDPAGELPGGRNFQGPAELKALLKADGAAFRRCFAEKLLTFAMGRGLEYYDRCAVDDICRAAKQADDRFAALVLAIVRSDPFQKRRGKREEP